MIPASLTHGCPQSPAWRLLYSEALADLVVVSLGPRAAVSEEISRNHVVYTLEEAERLEGAGDPLLRAVHLVKRVFGGEVVEGPGDMPAYDRTAGRPRAAWEPKR